MKLKLGDILNSINTGKEPIIGQDNERDYLPFIVSRCLSNFPDTLFHVNELNAGRVVDRKMHYDYLFHAIRKRKRFSPWQKKEESSEREAVSWFYGVSGRKAEEYCRILKLEDLGKIIQEYKNSYPD